METSVSSRSYEFCLGAKPDDRLNAILSLHGTRPYVQINGAPDMKYER